MSWRSLDDLIELTEAPDNAGLGIWDRADIEPHTTRIRLYIPKSERNPQPGSTNRRKTHCPFGHAYTEENTYIRPDTKARECKACRRERRRV